MTEKKQITIYELLPLLKPGWVAMDENYEWHWFPTKPEIYSGCFIKFWWTDKNIPQVVFLSNCLNICKFDGDWKDSLMEVK